jgi:hypothetical protein
MAEVVVILDLPIISATDLSTVEIATLLQNVKPANIIDYVDSNDVEITLLNNSLSDTAQEFDQRNENILQYPEGTQFQ